MRGENLEIIKEIKCRGNILKAGLIDSKFVLLTDNNIVELDLDFNILSKTPIEGQPIYCNRKFEEILTKEKALYKVYNRKGKIKKSFTIADTVLQVKNASPPLLLKRSLGRINLINLKGRSVREILTKDSTSFLKYFEIKEQLHGITALGSIINLENDEKVAQILGEAHFTHPFEIFETTPLAIVLYNSKLKQEFKFDCILSNEVSVSRIHNHYLIHDLRKERATILTNEGHLVLDEIPLTKDGIITITKRKLFRLDKFGENFQLDYTKL